MSEPFTSKRTPSSRSVPGRSHERDDHPDQAQRGLHREDRPPPDRLDEWTAGHHPEHRCAGGHEAPVAERLHPHLRLEQAVDVRHRRRAARRAGRRREDAERDHRRRAPGHGREGGEDPGHQQTGDEHPLVAPQVAGLAERRAHHTEGEHRAGDRPVEDAHRGVEVVGDALQRHDEDRDREAHREQPAEHHPEHRPARVDPDPRPEASAQQDRPRHDTEFVDAGRIERERAIDAGARPECTFSRPCSRWDSRWGSRWCSRAPGRPGGAGSGWCCRGSGGTPTISEPSSSSRVGPGR